MSLNPDLCLATRDGNPLSAIKKIESFGIPIYAVAPEGLDSVLLMYEEVADILGVADKGREIIRRLKDRIDYVKKTVRQTEKKPSVFFQADLFPIVSAGKGTYIDELIHMAGGVNLAAESSSYPRFTREEVLALAPEVIIIATMVKGKVTDRAVNTWMDFPCLPAVKQSRIHIVNPNLFLRPTGRLVDGAGNPRRITSPVMICKKEPKGR